MLVLSGDLVSFETESKDPYYNLGGYIYVDKMFNPILGIEGKLSISQISGEQQVTGNSGSIPESAYYIILAL